MPASSHAAGDVTLVGAACPLAAAVQSSESIRIVFYVVFVAVVVAVVGLVVVDLLVVMVGLVFLGGSYVACHSSTAEPEESAKDTLGP